MCGSTQRLKMECHQLCRLNYNNLNKDSDHVFLPVPTRGEDWVSHEKFFKKNLIKSAWLLPLTV